MQKIVVGKLELGCVSGNKMILNEKLDIYEANLILGEPAIPTVWKSGKRKLYFFPNSYVVWKTSFTVIVFYFDGRNAFEVAAFNEGKVISRHETMSGLRRRFNEQFTMANNLTEFTKAIETLKLIKVKPLTETIGTLAIDVSSFITKTEKVNKWKTEKV